MAGRLAGKMAVVVGAGQTPGQTIGNGRATAILFAREGATVMCVDRRLDSAAESSRRSTQSTVAPSRANRMAVARPLPMVSPGVCPAPTTTAVLPASRPAITRSPASARPGSRARRR